MNKLELRKQISEKTELSETDSEQFIDSFIKVVIKALKEGDTISLVGFGSLSLNKRSARTGRNPQTGETLQIAEKMVPTFKAGKKLKDSCNS